MAAKESAGAADSSNRHGLSQNRYGHTHTRTRTHTHTHTHTFFGLERSTLVKNIKCSRGGGDGDDDGDGDGDGAGDGDSDGAVFLIARAAHREIGCPNHLYM